MRGYMSSSNALMKRVEESPVECFTTGDLIYFGIFTCATQAYTLRKNKKSPPYIQLSQKKVVYPKVELIAWLRERFVKS